MDIVAPSDFKIKLTHIYDADGNELLPSDIYLYFIISDKYEHTYEAKWMKDNAGSDCVYLDEEDGLLYIVVQNYNLKGPLFIKIGTAVDDSHFKDNLWNWWAAPKKLDINII